ncbi:SDR family NAD(P)-dependent oxidoreductase [Paenibacillus sp. 2TAB23]|uniref:SDR family NAD(P)-dependent oxidoreductase n=1 Tax=Paenibacillus sp. 2TAB23 TaxID=3233004 RepID=UPI003F9A06AD
MNILITGADRGLGFGMAQQLLQRGHIVFAGQYMDDWNELKILKHNYPDRLHLIGLNISNQASVEEAKRQIEKVTDELDAIINNAGVNGRRTDDEPLKQNYDAMLAVYNVNTIGAIRITEVFHDMLEKGREKRLIFVSSEAGSITESKRTDFYSYCMSKAALNMYVKILYNRLHPDGYRFRLYHPGWIKSYMGGQLSDRGELTIEEAANRAIDYFFDQQVDENQLVLRGYDGNIHPF